MYRTFRAGMEIVGLEYTRQVIRITYKPFGNELTDQSLGIRSRGNAPCRSVADEALRPPTPRHGTLHPPL